MKYIPLGAIACVAVLLAGCDPNDVSLIPPDKVSAVCKALGDPIRYTSTNKVSKRYAAILLAMDLKQRNSVGITLHCPGYHR